MQPPQMVLSMEKKDGDMRSMLLPALLALAVLVAGCSDSDRGSSGTDGDQGGSGDQFGGGNGTDNGTGNGTADPALEEMCETDPDYQDVGEYYVKSNGPADQEVYEESNGMPDLQTPDTCPANPDDQVTFQSRS